MPPQQSQPHLPRALLLNLLNEPWMKTCKSFVFTPEGHRLRCQIANGSDTSVSAETYISGHLGGFFMTYDEEREQALSLAQRNSLVRRRTPDSNNSRGGSRRKSGKGGPLPHDHPRYTSYTVLNKSIDDADPLLACETIRVGALINQINGRGQTPLLQTLERMDDIDRMYEQTRKENKFTAVAMQEFRKMLDSGKERLKYIAVLLTEQHADVNKSTEWQGKTVTPLYLAACVLQDFDLVARLLTHGANPNPPSPASSIKVDLHDRDLTRFNQLTSEIPYGSTRLPRACPCFSGKSLPDCHDNGEVQSYPDEFLCGCASKKTYGKCCKLRNMETVERWNEEGEWIQPSRVVNLPLAPPTHIGPDTQKMMESRGLNGAGMREMLEKSGVDPAQMLFNPEMQEVYAELMELACKEEKGVDPAFAWAYLELKYYPSPQGRSSSKKWCQMKQKEWNTTVDRYIALGTDPRPKQQIEWAAKIGNSLGPLYRTCEAPDCENLEGRDVEKVLTCSRCKMTYYCSTGCQKSAWKEHKKICGTIEQREGPLPSQTVIEDFVQKFSLPAMMYRMGTTDLKKMMDRLMQGPDGDREMDEDMIAKFGAIDLA